MTRAMPCPTVAICDAFTSRVSPERQTNVYVFVPSILKRTSVRVAIRTIPAAAILFRKITALGCDFLLQAAAAKLGMSLTHTPMLNAETNQKTCAIDRKQLHGTHVQRFITVGKRQKRHTVYTLPNPMINSTQIITYSMVFFSSDQLSKTSPARCYTQEVPCHAEQRCRC